MYSMEWSLGAELWSWSIGVEWSGVKFGVAKILFTPADSVYLSGLVFLAHLSLWFMVSYCDRWMYVVRRQSCDVRRPSSTIASNDISSYTTGWILTKLERK